MAAVILDGEKLAASIREELSREIEALRKSNSVPYLTAVQVGENPASKVYVNQQKKACNEIGIGYELKQVQEDITEKSLVDIIEGLNNDKKVTGIILQMPVPKHIDARRVQRRLSPLKDVEGMHPFNMGMLVYGDPKIAPCTARGAIELLKSSGVSLKGKEVVVVGHSEIVGKPIALFLLQSQLESATPTVCHIATRDLASHTRRADIVIVAAGKPNLIKADMLKDGAMVIDVGINRIPVLDAQGQPVVDENGKKKMKTVGDVEFDKAKDKCSFISPVPGGVGPLTVAMLLRNCVECVKEQKLEIV